MPDYVSRKHTCYGGHNNLLRNQKISYHCGTDYAHNEKPL